MRPAIAHATLYSTLVTRPTGRAVRTNVERQIAAAGRTVLAVLDMRHVRLIDFSCADEIVAKLVLSASGVSTRQWFVLFRGVGEQHIEPIESALRRQGLAAAAESADGQPLLLGALEPGAVAVWREIWTMGRVRATPLATRLEIPVDQMLGLLDELVARALVIRDGDRYVSLGRALRDAAPSDAEVRGGR